MRYCRYSRGEKLCADAGEGKPHRLKGGSNMKDTMNDLTIALAKMRLIAEGALSLYEKTNMSDDDISLIGDALYFLREAADDCLKACQEDISAQ